MCCTEKKGYAEMKELITVGCIVITFDLTLRVLESVIKKCNAKHRRKEDKLIKRKDLLLVKTCGMFPEQYDAYIKETEEMVGYFRLLYYARRWKH